jgi:hypothetical protein
MEREIQALIDKYEAENIGILKRNPYMNVEGDFTPDGMKLFCNQSFIEDLKTLKCTR